MITDKKVEQYCIDHSTPPGSTHKELIQTTHQQLPQAARMQVGALEGRFLSLIAQITGTKTVLEFGTFTGYSALSFAEGLPAGGKVTTLDIDPKATKIAQEHWNKNPNGKKIELILGSALDSAKKLAQEIRQGLRPKFDLAFIDADKANYENYYEASLGLLKSGGVILIDNVLWNGEVLAPEDAAGEAIAKFNEKVTSDNRVEKVLLPIRDGIYLIRT
ncbi:MAG: class I SAM-dependent methyltransferase [Bdellovibrionales bacterium]|nr:class I SAM-dependent methyltransferase [Bdellovibrionales bacterium]